MKGQGMKLGELLTTIKIHGDFGLSTNFETDGRNALGILFESVLTPCESVEVFNNFIALRPKWREVLDAEVIGIKSIVWYGEPTTVFVLAQD